MATRRDYQHGPPKGEPDTEPIPVPAQPATAPAPAHGWMDVHTGLTLLFIALTVVVWTVERFSPARDPMLVGLLTLVLPYWYGTRPGTRPKGRPL